jgi:hypothetical protein
VTRTYAPSSFDLIFAIVAPLTAVFGAVRLTQNDGDLSAHLRMGETILSTGHIPFHSLVSYTAPTDFLVSPGWLSEIIFAVLFRVGGLPLLAVMTGLIIAATHGMIALFLKKHGADPRWALLAALISLSLAATHWLTRPHLFSIVGATLTLFFLMSEWRYRNFLCVPFFALWANLHGGWLYGLIMIVCFLFGEMLEAALSARSRVLWLHRARRDGVALVLASASVLFNPYGATLYKEVFSAVTNSSLSNNIVEFLPPNFHSAAELPFYIAIVLLVVLFAITIRRPPATWLILIVVSLLFALRSARNIALFGVSAWPLIALHTALAWPKGDRPFPLFTEFARIDRLARVGILAIPITILMLALGLNRGHVGAVPLISDNFSPKAFPTVAVDSARRARLEGRVYDAWEWGGYIMYAWPSAKLHVDPLKFNDTTMKSYSIIDGLQPGWEAELDRWDVSTVIVPAVSPLARQMKAAPQWKSWYRDSLAIVFRRSSASDSFTVSGG